MIDPKKLIIFLLCLGNITISFNAGAVAAAIPIIADGLSQSDVLVSRVVSYYMVPYGLGALLYAPLTRYWSYQKILIGAMALYAVASFASGMSLNIQGLFNAQILAGVAAASSTPLSLMIIGDFFDKDVRGRLVGTYFGCSFFASTIGMFFMGTVDWRWLFFIPALLGTITVACLCLFKSDLLKKTHQASVNYIKAFGKDHIRNVFALIFVMSFLYHAVQKWYGVYLSREYHLDKFAISLILILASVCGLTGQQIGGFLSDKKGRIFTAKVGMVILSAGIILLSQHVPIPFVVAILGAIAMGWTVGHNAISTVLTDFPDDDRPIIASLNSSVRFVSGGIGFYLSSFLVAKSFSMTFLGIGILMLATAFFIKKIIPSFK